MCTTARRSSSPLMTIAACLLVCIACFVPVARAEFYTALAEMEELLDTETVLIANLEVC